MSRKKKQTTLYTELLGVNNFGVIGASRLIFWSI